MGFREFFRVGFPSSGRSRSTVAAFASVIVLCSIPVLFVRADPAALVKTLETDRFVFFCTEADRHLLGDLDAALETHCPEIEAHLQYNYRGKISVEIHPDQKSLDESVPEANRGFPGYSERGLMKLVSPDSHIRIQGIPYGERLMMPVHEFAHILVGEINPHAPIWLNEGLACHEGSYDFYEYVLRAYAPELPPIGFADIRESYYGTKAADVYSYSAVRFIVERFGYDKLNSILRKPDALETILSMTEVEFSDGWNDFIRKTYRNRR